MSRDSNGNYSLPAGNPVVADTLIDVSWANPTMADIASALTDSLSRSGKGGMQAPLYFDDGIVTLPGISWANAQSSGWYRAGANDFRYSVAGVDVLKIESGKITVIGALNLTKGSDIASAATLNLTTATGNLVHVTGTTAITAVTLGAGMSRQVVFDGILTLTHHATDNNLPGAANITTAAGDRAIYWSDGTTVYCVVYQRADGSPIGTIGTSGIADKAVTPAKTADLNFACGRLTLTSATPVTSADVTGATTVYFTPYKGNVITLYDGADWIPRIFSELSQATTDTTKSPAAVANNSGYDIFVWNDSGTLRATRGPAWSSMTPGSSSRGTGAGTTELELFEGRYVNKVDITNGPAARRGLYVGTIKSDGSAQINDSQAIRNVWNNYNRVARSVKVTDSTDTWSYTTNTWRQANGAAANLIEYVCGLAEDAVDIRANANASNNSGAAVDFATGVGVNSSSAKSSDSLGGYGQSPSTDRIQLMTSRYAAVPPIGRNQFVWLEISIASGTTTWFGDGGVPGNMTNGLNGEVMA